MTRVIAHSAGESGVSRAAGVCLWTVTAMLVMSTLAGCAGPLSESPRRIPSDLVPLFRAAAERFGPLSAAQLAAQARVESKFDTKAVSHAGAQGIMQFLPSTWSQFGLDANGDGAADPLDPEDAIVSAARYDAHLAEQVRGLPGDHISLVLAAYNAGPRAVLDAGGVPDIQETREYVSRVHTWANRFTDQV